MSDDSPSFTEAFRLAALEEVEVSETAEEPLFAPVAARAAELCGTPIALVTFISEDKQWIKASVGLVPRQISRESAFCAWAVHTAELFWVEDALNDERFSDNPLVLDDPHIRFYAGAPIATPEGYVLGAVCIIDREPRTLRPNDRIVLEDCANEISAILRQRKSDPRVKV